MDIPKQQENSVPENSIESDFQKWLETYKLLIKFRKKNQKILTAGNKEGTQEKGALSAYHGAATNRLQACLKYKRGQEQQDIRIKALLLLSRLYDGKWEEQIEIRERYFYEAVELVREHLWDGFQNTPLKRHIIRTYKSIIDPDLCENIKGNIETLSAQILWALIISKSKNRLSDQELQTKQEAESIRVYLKERHTSDEIITKLKSIFWPVQLSIVSENSNETIMEHNKTEEPREVSENSQSIAVDIFHKPQNYSYTIDRMIDKEIVHWFEEHHFTNVISPLLGALIKELEESSYRRIYQDNKLLDEVEENMPPSSRRYDYHPFVSDIIHKLRDRPGFENQAEDDGYIDDFLQALDICRIITTKNISNPVAKIHYVLWGKIKRNVLRMAKSMLLSRYETMSGLGYPSGLSKKEIPLEGRIYSVIRVYETLLFKREKEYLVSRKPNDTGFSWEDIPCRTMEDLYSRKGTGQFDPDILQVLKESVESSKGFKELPKLPTKAKKTSKRQSSAYDTFTSSCRELLEMEKEIGSLLYKGHLPEMDIGARKAFFKKADRLYLEFIKKADFRQIFILTRHDKTASDTLAWPLGSDDECLIPEWEEESGIKWKKLRWLHIHRILTGPLRRTLQTAEIICSRVNDCLDNASGHSIPCNPCPKITVKKALTNPPKDLEDGRWHSFAKEVFVNPYLMDLQDILEGIACSMKESISLCVTHGDTARHIILLLKNLFKKDEISGKRIPIDNDEIMEFVIRWGKLLSREEAKTRGLLFSITNWKSLTQEINTLSESIFGDIFHKLDSKPVHLIDLHNLFLDFINIKEEESPEKLEEFIKNLSANPATEHFYDILKTEGVVE